MGQIQGLKKPSGAIQTSIDSPVSLAQGFSQLPCRKVPIIQWITGYSLAWLWSDLVAGENEMQDDSKH